MNYTYTNIYNVEVPSEFFFYPGNTWLSDEVACGDVEATSLIPVSILPTNSVAIESKTLLVGSDNEAIYIVENVYN